MTRWSPGRLQSLGYLLCAASAVLLGVVAAYRPRMGVALLIVAAILVVVGAVVIWLAQTRAGHS